MIAFAESTTCRMAALVRHFGDTSDKTGPCGLCDICNPSGAGQANAAHQPTQQERTWLRQILSALESRSTSTGKLFTDLHLTKDRNDFDTLLDALARAGLTTITNDTFRTPEGIDRTYKKISITHDGRSAITHEGRLSGDQTADDATLDTVWIRGSLSAAPTRKSRPTNSLSSRPERSAAERPASPASLTPAAEALFQSLRNWRTELARPTKTPAFLILSDAVLRAIATRAPQNLTELSAIPGIGPSRVDKYGADLIALCRGTATLPTNEPVILSEAHRSRRTPTNNTPPEPSGLFQPPALAPPTSPRPAQSPSAVRQNKPTPPTAPPAADLTPAQQTLEDRLKAWRSDEARTAGLPSFFILSDTVLRSLAHATPQTLADLSTVRGLPLDKIDRFGSALLSVVKG